MDEDDTAEDMRPTPFADDVGAALWRDARWWVEQAFGAFGDLAAIATVGLTRRAGLRLKGWLYSIEGGIRRLVLAAALQLAPATLAASAVSARPTQSTILEPKPAKDRTAPKDWRVSFRVFSVAKIRRGPKNAPRIWSLDRIPAAPPPKPVRLPRPPALPDPHHPFTADPLLAINAAEARAKETRKPASRRAMPKPKKGRLSRWHPDYNPKHDPDHFLIYGRPSRGLPLDREEKLKQKRDRRGGKDRHGAFGHAPIFSIRDEIAEAARLFPALKLAKRLEALRRVMADPQACIRRVARMLARHRDMVVRLAGLPPPPPRKLKALNMSSPPALDFLEHTCRLLRPPAPDTS